MILTDIQQGTPEWVRARVGCVTASRMSDVMAKLKRGGEAASRANYRDEIVVERLTDMAVEHYVSPYMESGIEFEPVARAAYEHALQIETEDVGIAYHDQIKWFAASPDALVGTDGLLEIKCPQTKNHIKTLLTKEIPEEYQWQMLAQMSCTGRQWCDFISYDHRLKPGLRLFIKRLERDEARIAEMEAEVCKFLDEVEQCLREIEGASLVPVLTESLEAAQAGTEREGGAL